MNRIVMPLPGTGIDERYPDSNGRFMGDTDFHNVAMIQLHQALEDHFADQPDVHVASNLVMYYKQGDARARRDPDVLVAKGVVGKHMRRSFRVWEENTLPCVLFEIASRKTWRRDVGDKRERYAAIGIKEYFIFEPERRYLRPPLQGFRGVRGTSVPLKPRKDGSLVSRELDLILEPAGKLLRLIVHTAGTPILSRVERIEREKRRADELAAEVERLKARIAELES